MADSYDDFLTEQGGGSGGGTATDDDSYAEFLRQRRQDTLAADRAAQRTPQTPAQAPAGPPAFDLNLSPLPAQPPAGAPLASAAQTMVPSMLRPLNQPLAPNDVTGQARAMEGNDVGLSFAEQLRQHPSSWRDAMASPGSAVVGLGKDALGFVEGQEQAFAEHPVDAAKAMAERVATAPLDVLGGFGDVGARGITSGLERMGVTLPRSSDDAPTYAASAKKIGLGLLDTEFMTRPALGAASDALAMGRDAMYTAAAGEARFQSALERAQADAMAARNRKASASAPPPAGPLALPAGQYDLPAGEYSTREEPETDPSRLLTSRAVGAGVPSEGPAVTAPIGMPAVDWQTPLDETKRAAADASAARQQTLGLPRALLAPTVEESEGAARAAEVSGVNRELRATPEEVDTYRLTRDSGISPSMREIGRPTQLPNETDAAYATRVANRVNTRDRALEQSAIAADDLDPAQQEAAARAKGQYASVRTASGASRSIDMFPKMTDDALHAHMAELVDTQLGTQRGALNTAQAARLNAAEAELESRGHATEDIWTSGLERGRDLNGAAESRKGFTAAGPLAMILGAGTGAAVGAAAAPPGERGQGAAAGAIAALGLVGLGTSLARDGRIVEEGANAARGAGRVATSPMAEVRKLGGVSQDMLDDVSRPSDRRAAPRTPSTLAEMDAAGPPTTEEIRAGRVKAGSSEPVTDADVAAARTRYEQRRRTGAIGDQPDEAGAAAKPWQQVRAEALGEPVKQVTPKAEPEEKLPVIPAEQIPAGETKPSGVNKSAEGGTPATRATPEPVAGVAGVEHTPATVRAAADALPTAAEHDATREILGGVAQTMETSARSGEPMTAREALDDREEHDNARDMAHTPEQYDAARKVLDEATPAAAVATGRSRYGAADPKLIKTLGLAALGAGVGGLTGDTPAEHLRNAALGLFAGGGLGALASREGRVLTAGEKAELGARATMERPPAGPKEAADAITATFAPQTRGEMANTAGMVVRRDRGVVEREVAIAQKTLDRIAGNLNKEPIAKKLGFVDAIEHGAQQSDITRQPVANSIRRTLDTERDAIRDMGKGKLDQFLENYFPHLWQDPEAAGQWLAKIMGKAPMEGSKSFLKRRTIPTVLEGMFPQGVPKNLDQMTNAELLAENKRQGGLVPVTFNPVESTMLKLREMKKYRMAQQVIGDLGERGLLKAIPEDGRMPVGYARINDWAFSGKAAPEPVARVLNNYLSPGLRGNAAYDAYMAIGNTLNQAQLGFSAFHAGMTTIETMVSQNALALEHLVQGKAGQALREFATFPGAPFSNYKKGEELRRAYLSAPGTITGPIAAIADGAAEGGARYHADVHNQASTAFSNALEAKQYARAAKQFLPAMIERVMGPVMNELVPRQKMGVFYDLAKSELEHLGPEAHPDEVTRAMQRAWDSVDNRMGQVVYDNRFWNRAAKDLFHASVRSVGWNWGTFQELGGGTKDLAGFVKDLATPGAKAELSHRAAYAMALPITLGILGSVTQKLYTGEWPDNLFDMFHPKTGTKDADGNDNRVVLPSYMKDVYSYGQHPIKTLTNKMNPLLSMTADALLNKDFYGDQIYDEPDFHTSFMQSLVTSAKAAGQLARYGAKAAGPFGVENILELNKRGASTSEKVLSQVGITPASREAVRSRAQNLMHDALARRAPQLTPEEATAAQVRAELRDKVRTHGAPAAMAELRAKLRDGTLTQKQVQAILQDDQTPSLVKNFKRLTLADAEKVYRASTSDREKRLWLPILEGKRQRAGQ